MQLLVPNLPLCYWSSQLLVLCRLPSSDVPILLLNQPIIDGVHVLIKQKKNVYYSSLNLSVISFVSSVYPSAVEPSVKLKQFEIDL